MKGVVEVHICYRCEKVGVLSQGYLYQANFRTPSLSCVLGLHDTQTKENKSIERDDLGDGGSCLAQQSSTC